MAPRAQLPAETRESRAPEQMKYRPVILICGPGSPVRPPLNWTRRAGFCAEPRPGSLGELFSRPIQKGPLEIKLLPARPPVIEFAPARYGALRRGDCGPERVDFPITAARRFCEFCGGPRRSLWRGATIWSKNAAVVCLCWEGGLGKVTKGYRRFRE